jgi:pimeloyl-ACP methyl ester carboxylesterase
MNDIIRKTVRYDLPGTAEVEVRRDLPFDGGTMDVYAPPGAAGDLPVVIIVAGFPDEGFARHTGSRFKDMGSSVSWARLIAATGLMAVTYTNRDPQRELHALLRHLGTRRIALWASSGNGPLALSLLMADAPVRVDRAVLCYPYTLDVPAEGQAFGFANPAAGRTIDDLAADIPLLVVRAGGDEVPRLNETLDRFVAGAIARDLPLTFINNPGAPHAFELTEDSKQTRAVVEAVLGFLHRSPA